MKSLIKISTLQPKRKKLATPMIRARIRYGSTSETRLFETLPEAIAWYTPYLHNGFTVSISEAKYSTI